MKNKKAPLFVVSDETVMNSHGFYVKTDGIDLQARFLANPVCLKDHINSTDTHLGLWKDIEKKDGKLMMRPDFDTTLDANQDVVRKVLNNKLRGSSIGISFNPEYLTVEDDKLVLQKCELFEVSIVAVPSNAGAIALFKADGQVYTDQEITQLTLSAKQSNNKQPKKSDYMKTIATHLKLNEDANVEAILNAVKAKDVALADVTAKLTAKESEFATLKTNYDTLKQAEDARLEAELTAELTAAVKDGRIDADAQDTFKELSHESAMKLLKSLPVRKSIAGQVTGVADEMDKFRDKTWSEIDKMGLLSELKELDPEHFEALKKAHFGNK